MADHDQLVRDLLPSPTTEAPAASSSPSPPAPPSRPQRRRPVTTEDLQHRTCWICADSEDDDDETAASASAGAGGRGASGENNGRAVRKRFVHPCKCTLVAHQSCLLHWIAQSRQNRPGEPVKCPQCQERYIIIEDRPWLLQVLDWADRQVGKAVSINVWILLSTTTLLGATAYGCVAVRLVLGKEAAARTLRAPWPLQYYVQMPLIPFALVASKLHFLRLFDPLTPWLIAFLPSFAQLSLPVLGFQYLGLGAQRRLATNRRSSAAFHNAALGSGATGGLHPPTRMWPPNPGPTAMLIPFVRFAYLFLRLQISKRVLHPLLDPRRANRDRRRNEGRTNGAGGAGAGAGTRQAQTQPVAPPPPTRTQRVVVLGAEGVEARLLDADPPPGTAAVVETDREATAEDEELFNAGGNEDGDDDDSLAGDVEGFAATTPGRNARGGTIHQQTVYITRQSAGRLVLNALTLPFAAAGMGSLLASLARLTGKGSWIRRFLGLNFDAAFEDAGLGSSGWRSPLGVMQDLFSRPPTSTSSTSTAGGQATPLSHIFHPPAGAPPVNSSSTSQAFQHAASLPPSNMSGEGGSQSGTWLANFALGGRGGATIYDDLVDAPWFRNAIGGLIVIALQDAFRITYRYLKLKQRGRMSVRDLPFEDHLVDSLDLRPGR
ncbi:hypothetical protein OC835_005810 [Tilletia horrida]|uniref:RING-CH-type domain-containing protein n=1 Tax=Tilletia horrida TaxID=155126 RepID=A0AAN6GHB5_9BASI|nr:hypothetical protein OC835_005810 [Tilletia horrida]KAK0540937.1 hypothetical protein OC842_000248 [Tilletia horrida]